ncbi:hypothetical protein NVP1101O_206 [Vibrio phage 1.101.O._10N.261.45.C6]|nr:hypothetical protein NVP1101O_206 [Vibrio phage 1.101.O._10N.261.45.C6]
MGLSNFFFRNAEDQQMQVISDECSLAQQLDSAMSQINVNVNNIDQAMKTVENLNRFNKLFASVKRGQTLELPSGLNFTRGHNDQIILTESEI